MQVDRHRVLKVHQARQPQIGCGVHLRPRGAQRSQFGIGGGDDDEISGRLAEIDGLGAVGDGARRGGEKMHGGPFVNACAAPCVGAGNGTPQLQERMMDYSKSGGPRQGRNAPKHREHNERGTEKTPYDKRDDKAELLKRMKEAAKKTADKAPEPKG